MATLLIIESMDIIVSIFREHYKISLYQSQQKSFLEKIQYLSVHQERRR